MTVTAIIGAVQCLKQAESCLVLTLAVLYFVLTSFCFACCLKIAKSPIRFAFNLLWLGSAVAVSNVTAAGVTRHSHAHSSIIRKTPDIGYAIGNSSLTDQERVDILET